MDGDIELDGVARRYGPRWAVAGVSLRVPQGEGVMLTGHNGSGKSTLLRCLSTAIKLHQGHIRIGGRDLWEHRHALRPGIGFFSYQGYLWDDLSGPDNLRAWARFSGISLDPGPLLERVGLPPRRTDPVRTYSAGMRRRLALARLLLQKPRLVLLDEPYNALDAEGRQLVTEIAGSLRAEGATLFMATHLIEYSRQVCTRHVTLSDGRLVRDEPLEAA